MSPTRVSVLGGGLAGLTAALACAESGCEVTLLEARPRLGGLTCSYPRDTADGTLVVDNGQHVFLRCCTRYRALLHRLGVEDKVFLQPRLDVAVREPGRVRAHRLTRGRAPAPAHLARSLMTYRALTPRQRLGVISAATALARVDARHPTTDTRSFGDWLTEHGQDAEQIAALWDLVGIATLNAPAEAASLGLAAAVFQLGMLTDRSGGDIGWPLVPLRDLHAGPAAAALSAVGARVRCRARAVALRRVAGEWVVSLRDGAPVTADHVIMAVPPAVTETLLPSGACAVPDGWAAALGASPIVNAHVVYDRTVCSEPFFAGLRSPVQWVFDRTRQSGLQSGGTGPGGTGPGGTGPGQYLAVSLSAAHDYVEEPTARLRALIEPELAALLPAARDASVRDFFVTRERAATFAPRPGTRASRPGTRTRMPGLWLAGAWTDTGWPATMEGAVRSGEAAAAAVLTAPPALDDARPVTAVGTRTGTP